MTLIKGETGDWEIVVGLEVHAQVISNAKLFSAASTDFGAEPNAQVSFVDAAMPGMLPVINEKCIEQAVRTGLGLKAEINLTSIFDRKNYFYPDLPAGYQISQYSDPIVGKGVVHVDLPEGRSREVGITRLHLEQDAGKSLHDQHPSLSYIDLNRCGIALMEIVSEPDMRSAEEAGAYLRKLRSILRYLDTCDGNMEEGSLRCDANVSVRKVGGELGTRCEIKNVNSIRFLMQAIDYEAQRQVEVLEAGGRIEQETRLYDANKGETRSMRSKEHAHDYRYFPDPDLLPLTLEPDWVEEIRKTLPELPDEKKERFVSKYKISPYQASVLIAEKAVADAFEDLVFKDVARKVGEEQAETARRYFVGGDQSVRDAAPSMVVESSAASTVTWVIGPVFALAKESNEDIAAIMNRLDLPGLLQLVDDGVISGRIAKEVFEIMFETGKPAGEIVEEKGLRQVSDQGAIAAEIDKVLSANAGKVAEYKAGKDKLFGFFVGQVMKATGGKANPAVVNEILKTKLSA